MQKYQDDLADLPDNNGGLQATLYSILTVGLVVSGATYLLQPQVWATTKTSNSSINSLLSFVCSIIAAGYSTLCIPQH